MQTTQELIDTITLAVADGATSEAKQAGAHACQTILAALDREPGKPLTPPVAPPLSAPDPGQMLDLVIAKLQAMVAARPPATEPPAGTEAPLRIPLLPMPTGVLRADADR